VAPFLRFTQNTICKCAQPAEMICVFCKFPFPFGERGRYFYPQNNRDEKEKSSVCLFRVHDRSADAHFLHFGKTSLPQWVLCATGFRQH
jgi:hypothetical protein